MGRLFLSNNQIRDINALTGMSLLFELQIDKNYLDVTEGSPDMAVIQSLEANGTGVYYANQKIWPKPGQIVLQKTMDLEIISDVGKTYQLESCADMQTWGNIDSPVPGTGRILSWPWTLPTPGSSVFYRIQVTE